MQELIIVCQMMPAFFNYSTGEKFLKQTDVSVETQDKVSHFTKFSQRRRKH